MGSAVLAAAETYPGKVAQASCKGQWIMKTLKKREKKKGFYKTDLFWSQCLACSIRLSWVSAVAPHISPPATTWNKGAIPKCCPETTAVSASAKWNWEHSASSVFMIPASFYSLHFYVFAVFVFLFNPPPPQKKTHHVYIYFSDTTLTDLGPSILNQTCNQSPVCYLVCKEQNWQRKEISEESTNDNSV